MLTLLACIAIYAYSAQRLSTFVPDDSYITFRYAENLAAGHGLTFNAGERPVEGYSNFLWILLCTLFSRLGFSLPIWIPFIGLMLGILSIIDLWVLLARHKLSPVILMLVLTLFSASGPIVLYAISGMETPLYILLLINAFLCLDFLLTTRRKYLWFMLLSLDCVLLSLCRPEGILTFPIIFLSLFLLLRFNKLPELTWDSIWKPAILSAGFFLGSMAIYHSWRIHYFHELLPTSFMSKGGNAVSLLTALKMNMRFYFVRQNRYFAPFGYYYSALIACGAAMLWLGYKQRRLHPVAGISMLIALIYTALYAYFVDWMPGMRYHAALVPLLILPAISLKDIRLRRINLPQLSSLALLLLVLVISTVSFQKLEVDARRNEESTLRCLVPLGNWLKKSMPPNAVLAIHDIGVVPYYSELQTIDSNPQSLTDLYIVKNGFSSEYFLRRNPDVAIFSSEGLRKRKSFFPHYTPLMKDPAFRERYKLIGISQYDHIQRSFWVYVRRDVKIKKEDLKKFPLGLRQSPSAIASEL
jgi:arabinofuranosyltransferase